MNSNHLPESVAESVAVSVAESLAESVAESLAESLVESAVESPFVQGSCSRAESVPIAAPMRQIPSFQLQPPVRSATVLEPRRAVGKVQWKLGLRTRYTWVCVCFSLRLFRFTLRCKDNTTERIT